MRATPGNYTHKPMPEQRAQLDFQRSLAEPEYRALIQGVIPRSQDDRWFAFEVDGWFSLCRSATGNCIFRVKLEKLDESWKIAEAWANRNPDQYDSVDDAADALMLDRLLDGIIEMNMT
jgi:hypothetical protein